MHSRFRQLFWLSLSLVPFYSFAYSQDSRNSSFVAVEVGDVTGAEVPNAQIKFVELSTKTQTVCPSNSAGKATCALVPGAYIATVTFPGSELLRSASTPSLVKLKTSDSFFKLALVLPGPCVEVTPICPNRGTVVVEGVSNSQGRPYEAKQVSTIVTYSSDGQTHVKVVKANLFRDSRGRIRIERFYDGTADPSENIPMDIMIDDNCGTSVILLPSQLTAKVSNMPALQRASDKPHCQEVNLQNPPYTGPEGKFENLGHKLVDGVEVRGERTSYYSSAQARQSGGAPVRVYENWCSILLDTPMDIYSLTDNPKTEITSVVTDIKQIEPGPASFEIPKEYKIVRLETTGPAN